MKSLVKILIVIIVSILPMFLIIGFARLATHGFNLETITFLPTPHEIMDSFNNAPDFLSDIKREISAFSKELGDIDWGFGDRVIKEAWIRYLVYEKRVVDFVTFFEAFAMYIDFIFKAGPQFFSAMGEFLTACSHLFVIAWYAIKTPFEFLGWFFGSFLGFMPTTD